MTSPKKRPLRWILVTVFTLLVLAVLTSFGVRYVGASRADEAIERFELRYGSFSEIFQRRDPRVDPGDNAAHMFKAGAAALALSKQERRLIGQLSTTRAADFDQETLAAIGDFLESRKTELALLRKASTLEQSSFGLRYGDAPNLDLPNLSELVTAGRTLMIEARYHIARGERDEAIVALRGLSRLAEILQAEPQLLIQLVGTAVDRMLLTVVAESLDADAGFAVDEAWLAVLEECIDPAARDADLPLAMRVEAANLYHWRSLGLSFTGAGLLVTLTDWYTLPYQAADYFDDCLPRYFDLPVQPFAKHRERFTGEGEGHANPNMNMAFARAQSVEALRQLVTGAIEIHRARLATRALPAARPDTVPFTRPDPFSGEPLVYTVENDGGVRLELAGGPQLLAEVIPPTSAQQLHPIVIR